MSLRWMLDGIGARGSPARLHSSPQVLDVQHVDTTSPSLFAHSFVVSSKPSDRLTLSPLTLRQHYSEHLRKLCFHFTLPLLHRFWLTLPQPLTFRKITQHQGEQHNFSRPFSIATPSMDPEEAQGLIDKETLVLKTRRNTYARITRLPNEVFVEIFMILQDSVADYDDINVQAWHHVAHVCRHWRCVSLQSASLIFMDKASNRPS
jgi:hypothetical protein